jgi:hypothetical protein
MTYSKRSIPDSRACKGRLVNEMSDDQFNTMCSKIDNVQDVVDRYNTGREGLQSLMTSRFNRLDTSVAECNKTDDNTLRIGFLRPRMRTM